MHLLDRPPSIGSMPPLVYPEAARVAGIEGRVFVRVLLDEQGRAAGPEIVKRVPADATVFDEAATRIAMESTYTPGIKNGMPVKAWLTIPIRFSLNHGHRLTLPPLQASP